MKTDSRLLPDGRRVGPLSWGCWRLVTDDISEARRRMETALSLGMNMIDTADVYGLDWGGSAFGLSESIIGRVLAQAPGLRDEIVLATKGGIDPGVPYDSSPAYLESAIDASLKRLGVERIDLWYVHRPDMLTHPADVADTLARSGGSGEAGSHRRVEPYSRPGGRPDGTSARRCPRGRQPGRVLRCSSVAVARRHPRPVHA